VVVPPAVLPATLGHWGRLPLTLERAPRFTVEPVTVTNTQPGLRVAQLAELVGVSPDTIRYYEREGLLAPAPRTAAGYRQYPPEVVERVRFIQGCQRLGLRLREIAELLAVRDTGTCPCEPAEQLLARRITELDAELARLTALRADLVRTVHALPAGGCPEPGPSSWCPPVERR
jgi:DNA-binding transcriptional MerR regulator